MKRLFIILLVFSSVIFSQWDRVDLMPMRGSMQSFYLIDSLNIIASFKLNLKKIVRSSDGGRSWKYTHDIPANISAGLHFVDSLNFFAAGNSANLIAKTSDGGMTWIDLTLPSSVVEVRSFQFVTTSTGYVYVNQGSMSNPKLRLLKTTNGGVEWQTLDTTLGTIYRVQFIDAMDGWLFGNTVYRTTDGGSTFTIFPTPSGIETFSCVDVVGNNIAFAGYRYFFVPPIYSTRLVQTALSTDGGSTWRVKDHGETMEGDPNKIKFIDSNTVVVLRPWFGSEISKAVLITTDKGLTWSEGNFPENTYYYYDFRILDGRVYMAGEGATFVASGQVISEPWEIRIATETTSILAADFSESGLVVAISGQPQIYISRDKGNSWFKRFSPVFYPGSVFISNDTTVYVGSGQILYKTDDLFSSIDTIAQFPGLVQNIQLKNNGDIWLSSNNVILSSSDNGMSWVTRYTSTGYSVSGLEVFDDGTVYAAIDGGVLKSTDYGISWVTLSLPVQNVYLIEFYDSKNGFIGKQGTAFYRTRDGGLTFQQLTIPGMSAPQKLQCQDSLTFMLSANELFSTYNGGWNWKVNEFSTQPAYKNFGWMYLFNQLDGIIIGYDKRDIFITTNAGNTPVELSSFTASQNVKKSDA
ncbi:MAG: hypothetical protein IPJ75_17425 [Ignavibacteriales bacterium]|nr:hypothetical protein [Ignavibacteriales bacterium]